MTCYPSQDPVLASEFLLYASWFQKMLVYQMFLMCFLQAQNSDSEESKELKGRREDMGQDDSTDDSN